MVPDEYSNAAVSFCFTWLMFSSESDDDDDGLRFSKSLKWITFGCEVRLVFGPKMTAGRLKLLTLSNSSATVITVKY